MAPAPQRRVAIKKTVRYLCALYMFARLWEGLSLSLIHAGRRWLALFASQPAPALL